MPVIYLSIEESEKIIEALDYLGEHDQPAKDLLEKLKQYKSSWTIIIP